jgi:hypothetical protein
MAEARFGSSRNRDRTPSSAAPVLAVGSLMEATCKRCKKTTSHRVERKIGSTPTLLACTICAEQRTYRRTSGRDRRRATATADSPSPARLGPEELWDRAMKGGRGPAVEYTATAFYPVGQRLSHGEFGDGVVTAVGSATVCTVTFRSGEKKLLMGSGRDAPRASS